MAGRKVTAAERAAISQRMKAYWRRRRGARKAPTQHGPKAPKAKGPAADAATSQQLIRLALIGVTVEVSNLIEVAETLRRMVKR